MATPEAIMALLAKAAAGDIITATWRFKPVDPLAEFQVDSSWVTWHGTVAAPLEGGAIIVEWDPKCPRLTGKRRRYFPDTNDWPDPECDYALPTFVRSIAKGTRREAPATPPPPQRPAVTQPPPPPPPAPLAPPASSRQRQDARADTAQPLAVQISADELKRLLKRAREDSSSGASSDSDEGVYDREAGVRVPMRNVVPGLRIPKSPDASSTVWYPSLWDNGAAWAIAARAKLAEFSCAVKSIRIKKDIDLDIDVIAELIDRRAEPEAAATDLAQHRNTYAIIARIVSNILLTSSMASAVASDQFLTAFSKALVVGRVDFAALIAARLTPTTVTIAEAPAPASKEKPATLKSESADYWRRIAEDATQQLERERTFREDQRTGRDNSRNFRDNRRKGKNWKPRH